MRKYLVLIGLVCAFMAHADESSENQIFYEAYDQIHDSLGTKNFLTVQEAQLALSHVIHHPVATLLNPETVHHYDPSGAIGFCFGRALATQLAARKLGLKSEFVKKIFVIGDMRSGATAEWRFHVTTIVKAADGKWYAIDPIVPGGRPVTAEQWLKWVRSIWDRPGKTNAYVTSGDVIIPNLMNVPEAGVENNSEVMSTTFKPETHDGVIKLSQAERFYDVSGVDAAEFQEMQFISTTESERFNASEITINNSATYKYNSYFSDLLEIFKTTTAQDILKPVKNMMYRSRSFAKQVEQESTSRRNELGSMRFEVIRSDMDWNDCLR